LLLTSGLGTVSYLLACAGGCQFTHASMLYFPCDSRGHRMAPQVSEVREWVGGRQLALSNVIEAADGRVAWLPLDPHGLYDIDRAKAVSKMKSFSGKPYGWWGIKAVSLVHLFGFRMFFWPDNDDDFVPKTHPFCSDAYSRSVHIAGQDPVARRAHTYTEPCDLYNSILFGDPIFLTLNDEKTSTHIGDAHVAAGDTCPGRVATMAS
jgi:hypothetical protein